jgi:hypothetical protein
MAISRSTYPDALQIKKLQGIPHFVQPRFSIGTLDQLHFNLDIFPHKA